jgi:LmbE family N-acetylglucosaminyl deacetylase
MDLKPVYALAISPHPFDNEWGMAGTVARWISEGKEVVYVICTNGDKGSVDLKITARDLAKTRKQEQLAAARLLGVKETVFLDYPDLEMEYNPALRKVMLALILKYRPEVVVTCDPHQSAYFSNPDHRVTARAVLDAVWPYTLSPNTYRDLIDTGLQPHKVKQILLWAAARTNYKVDITQTFETKMAAIRCHRSQVDVLPAGWYERLVERNRAAAKGEAFELAEAFQQLEVLQRL